MEIFPHLLFGRTDSIVTGMAGQKTVAFDVASDEIKALYQLMNDNSGSDDILLCIQANLASLAKRQGNNPYHMPVDLQEAIVLLIMAIRKEAGLPEDMPISRREIRTALRKIQEQAGEAFKQEMSLCETTDLITMLMSGVRRHSLAGAMLNDNVMTEHQLIEHIYAGAQGSENKVMNQDVVLWRIVDHFDNLAFTEVCVAGQISAALQETLVIQIMLGKRDNALTISVNEANAALNMLINHASLKNHPDAIQMKETIQKKGTFSLAKGLDRYLMRGNCVMTSQTLGQDVLFLIHQYLPLNANAHLALTSEANLAIFENDRFWQEKLKPGCRAMGTESARGRFKNHPEYWPDDEVARNKKGRDYLISTGLDLGLLMLAKIAKGELTIEGVREQWKSFNEKLQSNADLFDRDGALCRVNDKHLLMNHAAIRKLFFDGGLNNADLIELQRIGTKRDLYQIEVPLDKDWISVQDIRQLTDDQVKNLNDPFVLLFFNKGWLSTQDIRQLTDDQVKNLNDPFVSEFLNKEKILMKQALALSKKVRERLHYWPVREMFNADLLSIDQLAHFNEEQFERLVNDEKLQNHTLAKELSTVEVANMENSLDYLYALGKDRKAEKNDDG